MEQTVESFVVFCSNQVAKSIWRSKMRKMGVHKKEHWPSFLYIRSRLVITIARNTSLESGSQLSYGVILLSHILLKIFGLEYENAKQYLGLPEHLD